MYDSESSSEAGWIEWFCDLEGHEFFVAVSYLPCPSLDIFNCYLQLKPFYIPSLDT